jgi:hypothetical protein
VKRFTVILGGKSIDLSFWVKTALAIFILFIIPLEIHYYEAIQPEPAPFYYDIWISSAIMDYVDWRDRNIPPVTLSEPVTIAAAIVICIPAILLNRRIRNQDPTQPIRDAGLAAFFGTAVLTIYLVEQFPPADLWWLIQGNPAWKLFRLGTLVMVTLIVLPLIIRETSHLDLQRRYRILTYAIGVITTLVPGALVASSSGDTANYSLSSISYQFWYSASIPSVPWLEVDQVSMAFLIIVPMDFLYYSIYYFLYLIFAFAILRYLQGLISKRRVFLLGALSITLPYGAAYQMVVSNALNPTFLIPLPFLFILGIIVLATYEPSIRPQTESSETERQPIDALSDPEVKIKVPYVYIIKSMYLGVKRRISKLRDRS